MSYRDCVQLLAVILQALMVHVAADYIFEVDIQSYSNPSNRLANGDCCDRITFCTSQCDPFYDSFCLRNRGHSHDDTATCFLGSFSSRVDDGVVRLTGTNPWPVQFQLYIRVLDEDLIGFERIDNVFADDARNASAEFSEVEPFIGDSGRATLTLSFRVVCASDYYGLDCNTFCQVENSSLGHFSCDPSTGNILCLPGYRNVSSDCMEPVCMEGCHPVGGYCESPDECLCRENWSGTLCDDLDSCLFAPCETGAVCINLMGNDSYTCLCPPGFEGNNCGENINDCAPVNPCVNGGTCIDLTADYSCTCLPGYTDENCSTNIDECEGVSCPGNSSCVDGVNSHECVTVCDAGFTGPNCEPGNADSQGSEINIGVVAGAAIGGFALLVIILLVILAMLLCLNRRANEQKAKLTAISSLHTHSSNDHQSYELYSPTSDVTELSEQPNVNFLAPSGLLSNDPLYGDNQPESTMDMKSPVSTTSTLHEIDNPLYGDDQPESTMVKSLDSSLHKFDNPLYGSGTNGDPMAEIYSEPNPSYIRSPQRSVKDGDPEPHAYARMNSSDKEETSQDCSPHYEYVSTTTQPQDSGEPYSKLDHGTNTEASLSRLANNGQYDVLTYEP